MYMKKQKQTSKKSVKRIMSSTTKGKAPSPSKNTNDVAITKNIDKIPDVQPKSLLLTRNIIRKGRPRFLRQESWRYVRIGGSWRKPRGIDSKMRISDKGWPKLVKIGYRSPESCRGLHPTGLKDILVHTINDLIGLNPDTDAIRLGSSVGARKRRQLVGRAHEMGLKVLNPTGLRRNLS